MERLRRYRILVIDDDTSTRAFVARALTLAGYEVTAVPDADAAFARVYNAAPDLLLLDYKLIGQDGLTLLERMREAGAASPALLFTATTDDAIEARAAEQGVLGVLHKPVGLDDLLAAIAIAVRGEVLPPGFSSPTLAPPSALP
ncbi:Nitrogen regulation protein NR(I) [Calidithermus terrae]|uniref:Nitrogen regulation protein NR(I) n=1 Tax=Calidithermus terrae TaxID=1408545 RepID=A0A399F2N6_9DEIN|nr:response regulator [Calidithermus terrae]RIH90353.1 Nitrogen regulation protein NR(I) [Calidithermus terrae]